MSLMMAQIVVALSLWFQAQADSCPRPKVICGPQPGSGVMTEAELAKRADRLHECICELSDQSVCKALPHYKLSKSDAKAIHALTEAATHKETWDNLELFAFEYLPRMASLSAALSFETVEERIRQTGGGKDRLRGRGEMAQTSLRFCEGLRDAACEARLLRPRVFPEESKKMSDALACVFRDTGDLWRIPVWDRWPGCPCANGEGAWLGKVCVNFYTKERLVKKPIDSRMPRTFEKFTQIMERKTGLKLVEAGLVGCTFWRFETGVRVKNLTEGSELLGSHISNHSRATACDLRYLVFQAKDGQPIRFDLAPKGGGGAGAVFPFTTALQQTLLGKTVPEKEWPEKWDEKRASLRASGLDRVYLDLEEKVKKQGCPESLSIDECIALKIGVFARNALRSLNLTVYDALTNSNHNSHFHFELPEDDLTGQAEGVRRAVRKEGSP